MNEAAKLMIGYDRQWITIGNHSRVLVTARNTFPPNDLFRAAKMLASLVQEHLSSEAILVEVHYDDKFSLYKAWVGTTKPDDQQHEAMLSYTFNDYCQFKCEGCGTTSWVKVVVVDPSPNCDSDNHDHHRYVMTLVLWNGSST